MLRAKRLCQRQNGRKELVMCATAQGRCIFTFDIADFVRLAQRHPRHGGIILAGQSKSTLRQLIAALDSVLSESDAEDWIGQLRWLNQWRG